jgi:hypothetical protein
MRLTIIISKMIDVTQKMGKNHEDDISKDFAFKNTWLTFIKVFKSFEKHLNLFLLKFIL